MTFEVILTDSFLKNLRKLKNRVLENQVYRLRVGKLRILYTIYGNKVYIEALVKDHGYENV